MHLLTSALDVNYIIPIHIASPECHPTVWELYAPHITHSMSVRGDIFPRLSLQLHCFEFPLQTFAFPCAFDSCCYGTTTYTKPSRRLSDRWELLLVFIRYGYHRPPCSRLKLPLRLALERQTIMLPSRDTLKIGKSIVISHSIDMMDLKLSKDLSIEALVHESVGQNVLVQPLVIPKSMYSIASLRLVSLDQLRTPIYMPICVGKAPRKRWVGPSLHHWIYSTILSWYQRMFLVLQVIPSTLGQCACTLR